MIRTVPIKVTTAGDAASATGTGESAGLVRGEVLGAFVNYHASAPATTVVTLRTKGGGPPSYNVAVLAAGNTDRYVAPRAEPVDNGDAAITNGHAPFAVNDVLEVAVTLSNALTDAVVVHVLVRD